MKCPVSNTQLVKCFYYEMNGTDPHSKCSIIRITFNCYITVFCSAGEGFQVGSYIQHIANYNYNMMVDYFGVTNGLDFWKPEGSMMHLRGHANQYCQ